MSHCGRCSFICSRFDSSGLRKPSNETLLCVAFVSFTGFTTVQSVVALIAQSEAMMGDSAAMAVDALTYGFNLYAERKKNEDGGVSDGHGTDELEIELIATSIGNGTNITTPRVAEKVKVERQLQRRRRHLHLELVPPLLSVSILMVVIGFVLRNSVHTLILDSHRSEAEQDRPNLVLMTIFSTLNLLLDVVNVTCFARAKHLMGWSTNDNEEKKGALKYGVIGNSDGLNGENGALFEVHGSIPVEDGSDEEQLEDSSNSITSNDYIDSEENDENERVNLNMCSAYTHVFADTLRSAAVIIASVVAQLVESVTPEVAYSTAAVIVSFIILVSLLPLVRGLFHTWCELRSITREEHALSKKDFEGEIN